MAVLPWSVANLNRSVWSFHAWTVGCPSAIKTMLLVEMHAPFFRERTPGRKLADLGESFLLLTFPLFGPAAEQGEKNVGGLYLLPPSQVTETSQKKATWGKKSLPEGGFSQQGSY